MAKRTQSSLKNQPNKWHELCKTTAVLKTEASSELGPMTRLDGSWIHAATILTLVVVCAGLYAWTVDFPMQFDDFMYMQNNPIFKDTSSFNYPIRFAEFTNLAAKMGGDPDLSTNFILRPVAYSSLHLNYLLSGFDPRWFRVVNILIHCANALLIYSLLSLLLLRSPYRSALPSGSLIFIPVTAALLFVAHPLATESVTYIIQRFTSLSTLLYLLTLWLYFGSLNTASVRRLWVLRSSAVVVLILGMLTKEDVFTAPMMAVLIDLLVNGPRLVLALKRSLPLLLCLPIIPALVIFTSMARHEGQFRFENALNIVNRIDDPVNHWHYIVTQITVVGSYLQHIFWPVGLNIDPEWPMYLSLLEPPVVLVLAALVTLIIGVGWMWRQNRNDPRSCIAFVFTLWFFITVSISSGLVPLPDLMADHRTYLPSIGIFILVACLLDRLRNWTWQSILMRKLVPTMAALCISALAWTTCVRNEVWRTHISLWEDSVAKSPGKYRAWSNLGGAYSYLGREEEAAKCFHKSIQIEPRFGFGSFNLSNSLLRLGRPQEALNAVTKMIDLNKDAGTQPDVVYTVGLSLVGLGRYDEALAIFKRIVEVMPDHVHAHRASAMVYRKTNNPQLALEHYRIIAKIQPPDENLLSEIRKTEAVLENPLNPVSSANFRLR
jgi:tetratricopeptide (TPR) repeat protein